MTSKVLEPLSIAGARLPSRVVVTAHGTNIGRGRISDDLIAYHRARARGGWRRCAVTGSPCWRRRAA